MVYLRILMLCASVSLSTYIQAQTESAFFPWKLELAFTEDLFSRSYGADYGFIFKAKRQFYRHKHWAIWAGGAYQNHYIDESQNKFTQHASGFTRDIGLYAIGELMYYPFARRHMYLALEPFVGFTHLKNKGRFTLPHLDIDAAYAAAHMYLNYGVQQAVGVKLGRVSIYAFGWLSMKGFWDAGRTRPADFDSRFFVGLGASLGVGKPYSE